MSVLLSVVIPCLDEERTLPMVLAEIKNAFLQAEYEYEVIVADNGSCDRSAEIAEAEGARVVNVPKRGYGAAIMGGIEASSGDLILIGDADFTYSFYDGYKLIDLLILGEYDMVTGTRLKGEIQADAMPALHRYIGTPFLSFLINFFFGGKLSDNNCGLRAFRRSDYESWRIQSVGMEFISELSIKSLRTSKNILEVPILYRKAPVERAVHMRTFRDGFRNLSLIVHNAVEAIFYKEL